MEIEFVATERKDWINVIEIFNADVRVGTPFTSNPGLWLRNGKFVFRVINLFSDSSSIFQGDDAFLQSCSNGYDGNVILDRIYRVRVIRDRTSTTIKINDSICQIKGVDTITYSDLIVSTGYGGDPEYSGDIWIKKFTFKNL